jgi:hypothetical protein
MGADAGGTTERMTTDELKTVIEEAARKEKVWLNKPLIGWAVVCGLLLGTGVGFENSALAFSGLTIGGAGLIYAEMYESGQKLVKARKRLGVKNG